MQEGPSHDDRRVARWLLSLCALVFLMVVLGGVTRLTGSGLSITDWRPVTGILPPLGAEAWEETFARYRQTPEFRDVNAGMDLGAFKGIFWLEYLHRLLGRLIGIAFLVPFAWFIWRGAIRRNEWLKYGAMFVLGGLQGLLGWYMVKSGLVDNPRVSQYRLTAHLLAAIAIYGYMLWVALSLLHPARGSPSHPWLGRTAALGALVLLTVVTGGFVAGLDAGLMYNTFPMMGEHWIPPGYAALEPAWRNLFENMAAVQFNHRLLAVSTFCVIVGYWWYARRQPALPRRARIATNAMLHAGILQVALGISTLLLVVPIALAAAHQAVALILLTAVLYLVHALWRGPHQAPTAPA